MGRCLIQLTTAHQSIKERFWNLRWVSSALSDPRVRRWRLVVSALLNTWEQDSIRLQIQIIACNLMTPTALRRENWMGSCRGESCRVKVFTRVGGHLKDNIESGSLWIIRCRACDDFTKEILVMKGAMYLWMNRRMGARVWKVAFSGFKSRQWEAVVAVHRTCTSAHQYQILHLE